MSLSTKLHNRLLHNHFIYETIFTYEIGLNVISFLLHYFFSFTDLF